MYNALLFVYVVTASGIHLLHAPKRLVRKYEKALKREMNGKELTAMEKDLSLWLFESFLSCCNKSKKTYSLIILHLTIGIMFIPIVLLKI